MYIVHANHDGGGHGEEHAVLLLSASLREAVECVREAESYGYRFTRNETGVYILNLRAGRIYHRREFSYSGNAAPAGYPVVFSRQWRYGSWREEWFDRSLAREFPELVAEATLV